MIVLLGLVPPRECRREITKSGSRALPLHSEWILISSWWPAPGPAIVFRTSSEPDVMISIRDLDGLALARRDRRHLPVPVTTTSVPTVVPFVVSITVHFVPTAIGS